MAVYDLNGNQLAEKEHVDLWDSTAMNFAIGKNSDHAATLLTAISDTGYPKVELQITNTHPLKQVDIAAIELTVTELKQLHDNLAMMISIIGDFD